LTGARSRGTLVITFTDVILVNGKGR